MLYVFDNYELDTGLYELRRAGIPVKLEPRVFNVLAYLVQHRERVVPKQELCEHLWPDQFVGDAAIERCIAVARHALGDSGHAQRYIRTLHGRGYRFMAGVEHRLLAPPGNQALVASLPQSAAPDHVQAVLPFTLPAAPLPPPAKTAAVTRRPLEGERKWVTVLCCTLVHAVSLTERLGAEAMYTLLQHFSALALTEISHYEGTVTQFLRDGFIALFGAPVAHEDHAQRAVLAACGLQRRLHEQWAVFGLPDGEALTVRMGLHTGLVIVGHIGLDQRMDYTAVGDTIHLAACLQECAVPGTILISTATYRFVQDAVRLEARRPVHVQGQAEPVAVYQVLGVEGRRAPITGLAERPRSQFVGRERELAVLHDLLQQAEDGQGRVVGIVGEPGMGKSRLLMEFHDSVRSRPVTSLAGQCLSYGHTVPYLPVRDIVRAQCGITEADPLEAMTAKVRRSLQDVGLDADEAAPYLFQLLGLQAGLEPLALLTPEAIKVRTFELLCQMSRRASQHQPLIIAVEDLHWIDASSEALFAALVESLVGASILFLATYRPGYRPLWVDKSYMTQIALHQLSSQESRTVVYAVAQREPLSEALLQTILAKAEGNPLFLEELTRAVLEQDVLRTDMPVPESIQGVLMARIDRLPEATKRVLQTASVLGRESAVRLLERLWDGPGDLTPHLQTLKRLEFLYERMGAEESTYAFKHPLIQEVAYDSLLLRQRHMLHATAGRALETLYADRLEAIVDRLAYHYTKTTEAAKAVEYLTRLAEKAARECAHAEAVTAWYEALEHLARLPNETQDREFPALGLRLVDSLHYLGRFTESLDVLQQQQARLAQNQDAARLGPCHVQLGFTYSMLGEHVRAVQHAHHALTAATHGQDIVTLGRAHYVLALESYWAGQPQQGVEHGRQAIALLEQTAERESLGMAYFYMALNTTLLGDFAPALAALAQAQALGEALGDPGLQSYTAWLTGWIHTMQGDSERGIALCQQSLAHSPHPLNTALALSIWGYACLEQGDPVQAITLLEQVVQHTDQVQYQRLQGFVMSLLGEAYGMRGHLDTARDLVHRGLDISQRVTCGPGVGVAQRALGRMAQRSGALTEAEHYLQEACATFAAMPARYELGRTHLDLAALGQTRDDLEAAATHLTEAYTLFTALRLPQYVARTAQLASVLGVALHRGDQ